MAALDYSTILMRDGKRVGKIEVEGFGVDAYKYGILFEKDGTEVAALINTEDMGFRIRKIPGASDIRIIRLEDPEDIKESEGFEFRRFLEILQDSKIGLQGKGKKAKKLFKNIRSIFKDDYEYNHLVIFRIGKTVFFWFPESPALGGATYLYVLEEDGTVSTIATGYGHNQNPALHWMNRGLSEEAENEICKILWNEMTSPWDFKKLLIGQVFDGEKNCIDGSVEYGGFKKDTLTDPDVVCLYRRIKEIDDSRA